MPVDRSTIKREVIDTLETVSRMDVDDDEKQELRNDLLLTSALVEGLAVTWTKLSTEHGGDRVSRAEAGETETVKDCTDLVFAKVSE